MSELLTDWEEPLKHAGGRSSIYKYDDTSTTNEDALGFLSGLCKGIENHGFKVELRDVKQSDDGLKCEVLEKVDDVPKSKKVILAPTDDKFSEDQPVESFNSIIQAGEPPFVAVIISPKESKELPSVLVQLKDDWDEGGRQTHDIEAAKEALQFLQDETKQVDVALMNLGTGLAWSYYFGYLRFILPIFEETLLNSAWRNENPDIPESRISKRIHVIFTTNCKEPEILNSERIKLKRRVKHLIDRAGLQRVYNLDIQEVKSKDGKESNYGVVCFLNSVQCLSEMKDDPNKMFFQFDEDDMRTHGRHCFEKLKLVIKYNEMIKKDQSKFDFIEFNTEAAKTDENYLADELFNRMNETGSSETRSAVQETGETDANHIGVLFDFISKDVKEFIYNLSNSNMTKEITDCPLSQDRIEFGLKIIGESQRIFMVLTDDFVESDAFEKWFYLILDKGFQMNNRRFVVCLNCLAENGDHPKVLELQQLFTSVNYTTGWADSAKKKLEGSVEEIKYCKLFDNIGTGLAMSWYYRFLKIKIPKVRDVIDQCPALKEKFLKGKMSHKVFILYPASCCCPEKVSGSGTELLDEVDSKEINLPQIKKEYRDYTPKVYSLDDDDKNEYYAFVEFSTPADTMYRMMQEGFLQMQEEILQQEWERFRNKLHELIVHEDEPMDIKHRTVFIKYKDDTNWEDCDLVDTILDSVKKEIAKEERSRQKRKKELPKFIDNGAIIVF